MSDRSCRACPDLFTLSAFQEVVFCNGARGRFIDDYRDREQVFAEFLTRGGAPSPCPREQGTVATGRVAVKLGADEHYPDYAAFAAAFGRTRAARFIAQRIFCFPSLACNNACRYCLSRHTVPPGTSDPQTLLPLLDRHAREVLSINFGGGEPTLYPHLNELLHRAGQHGLFTQIFTNARRLADPAFTGRLLATGIDRISVTLPSHDEQVHDRLTRAPGSWRETVAGLQQLQRAGFRNLTVLLVVHRENHRQLNELVRFALSFQPRQVSLNALVLLGEALVHRDELALPLSETVPQLEAAMDLLQERGVPFTLASFPLCLFRRKYWRFASNYRYTVELHTLPGSEQVILKQTGMALTPKCVDCALKEYCSGTWYTYYQHFGDREFSPLPATISNIRHLHPVYRYRRICALLTGGAIRRMPYPHRLARSIRAVLRLCGRGRAKAQ